MDALQVLQRPIDFQFPWKGLGIFGAGSVAGIVISTWFFLIPFHGFTADIEKSMILFENVMTDIKRVSFTTNTSCWHCIAALQAFAELCTCALCFVPWQSYVEEVDTQKLLQTAVGNVTRHMSCSIPIICMCTISSRFAMHVLLLLQRLLSKMKRKPHRQLPVRIAETVFKNR
jgi:hypothetical protein